jgi:hypothetical protein
MTSSSILLEDDSAQRVFLLEAGLQEIPQVYPSKQGM